MRRVVVGAGTVSLALALFPGAPGSPVAAAPVPKHLMPRDTPFSYPAALGTTWVYRENGVTDVTITVARVESKDGATLVTTEFVRANSERAHHTTVSVSNKGLFLLADRGTELRLPSCLFKLPHKDGDAWKAEGHGNMELTAGPVEKVETVGGEFTACRVEWPWGREKVLYWYAPGVGLVRMDGGTSWSLKSFTRARD